MRNTAALVRHNTILLLREPGPLLSRMILPLAFLVTLRPLYTAAQGQTLGTTQAVLGALVTFSLLAMSIVGGAVLSERIWHTWHRLRATSLHPVELLAGKAIPVLGALLAQQVVIVGFGVAVLHMRVAGPALLLLAMLAWTLVLLGIGSALGVLANSFSALSAGYDVGGLLLSSLGGALVPISAMPGWIAAIAPVSPGYWAVSALRAAADGNTSATLSACAVLTGFAVAAGLVAAWRVAHSGLR